MYVSIDKQLTTFQNCLGFLSRFARKRVKILFLFSNVSLDSTTLFGHVTCFPRAPSWVVTL